MPSLPKYESQVAAQANRRIIDQPTFEADDAMGSALQNVGKVGLEIAARVQRSQTDQQLAKAETDARTRLDRLKHDLEADPETPDVAIPKRWQQESEAILKEAADTIGSQQARELWLARAKGWQAEGETWSLGLQRKRTVDKVRAGHVELATGLEAQAGDLSISEQTFAESVTAARVAVQRDVERGILDAEDGAKREAGLDLLALKDRTMRWTANIDALVKDGRIAEAQAVFDTGAANVDPATRERVRDGLDASKQDYAVVEKSDTIWERAKGDYGRAIKLAAEIKDAPLRVKVEQRIGQLTNQAKAAEDEWQENLKSQMWAHVEGGGTIMNAPPSLRAAIDPEKLGSIRAFENARDAESGMNAAQKKAWTEQSANIGGYFKAMALQSPALFMADQSQWSEADRALYAAMTPSDQLSMMTRREEMITSGKSADSTSGLFTDLMREAKRWAPADWKLGGDSQDARKNKDNQAVTALIYKLAEELAPQLGGQRIAQKDAQYRIAQLFSQYKPGDSWLAIPEWAQAKGRADSFARLDAKGRDWAQSSGIDWALWNEIRDALPADASADDVQAEYLQRGGRMQ